MTATKGQRHQAILALVNRGGVHTQQELAEALARRGLRATQATISRDIRELGLVKTQDSLGGMRYVLPNREQRTDPRDTLETLLRQFGRQATPAENIVVVQELLECPPEGRNPFGEHARSCARDESPLKRCPWPVNTQC